MAGAVRQTSQKARPVMTSTAFTSRLPLFHSPQRRNRLSLFIKKDLHESDTEEFQFLFFVRKVKFLPENARNL